MSYEHDTHIQDAAGNKRVSYGPRRIEVERIVDGRSYVSYRQHHPENDDPDASIEACLPAEAAFWGVYQHDAEGLASIVGDAHDKESAKAFATTLARNLELEARLLTSSINAIPRVVLVMEGEHLQNIVADCAIDVTCLNYDAHRIDEFDDNGLPIVDVPQGNGSVQRAVIGRIPVEVDLEETAGLFALHPEASLEPQNAPVVER